VGDGHAGVGGDGHGRGDSGHHLERHPRPQEGGRLLTAAGEDDGSPPFRRTTLLAGLPRSTSSALISSWGRLSFPGDFPTLIRSAPAGASSSRLANR